MIVRIDLDDTLCSGSGGGDYQAARARTRMIEYVNNLHAQGHRIIIETYRGDTTKKDWRELTEKQLKMWGVKHHELRMRKEHYDAAIDDKAVQPWLPDAPPRFRYMIGYGVWNRQDQVAWALDGIAEHCPHVAHIGFVADSCDDESVVVFDSIKGQGFLKGIATSKFVSTRELGEIGIHDVLMHQFVEHTDCDALIVMHHDQRFAADPTLVLDKILTAYNAKLGIIGLRAGFEVNLSKVIGSRWGASTERDRLPPGAWAERTYMNTGPIVYPRSTVEKVGYLDGAFEHWFIWEDYAARCAHEHGLKNVVADVPIRHVSFGRTKGSTYYHDDSHKRDRERMRKKWGRVGW